MTISIFSISALLLSLVITVRALFVMLRQDHSARAEGRKAAKLLALLLPIVIILTMAMYRYTQLAAWSKSILPSKVVSLLRAMISVVFGTRSFSLMLQTMLVAITIPTLLLSLYVIVTDCVVMRSEYLAETVLVKAAPAYRSPSLGTNKTFLNLLQIRI